MKIFFTVSNSGLPGLLKNCGQILKELKSHGANVTATFDKSYWKGARNLGNIEGVTTSEDQYRFVHDRAIRRAIFRADAVVIEASYPSFRLGFEAFFALSQQKPVLVLSQSRNYGRLIDQPNFFGAKYTLFTIPDIVEGFLKHVRKNKLRNRFNLFISDEHKKHIEDVAKRYGVSMSDYIRRLIENDKGLSF